MLWLKTFHILFVMSWMAGIFYLPRIFVHFVEGKQAGQDVARLAIMGRKLYVFMTIMMMIAITLGLWLWIWLWLLNGIAGAWLYVKLLLVGFLLAYHWWCRIKVGQMEEGHLEHSGKYYRWLNELPLFITIGILIMVVVKPF